MCANDALYKGRAVVFHAQFSQNVPKHSLLRGYSEQGTPRTRYSCATPRSCAGIPLFVGFVRDRSITHGSEYKLQWK